MLAQVSTATDSTVWIWIAVAVLVVVGLVAFFARRQRSEAGSPQRAEAELARREKRVHSFDIKPLTPGARERYAGNWRRVQARFVDDPAGAVRDADQLLSDVMRDRGYPVNDAEHRMEDLSVEHAGVLNHYRMATGIAQRSARGRAPTEDLRQAIVYYRSLFSDLLGSDPVKTGTVEGRIVEPRAAAGPR